MTRADDLAQQAPQLKALFDQAIQASHPDLVDPKAVPDQHVHLLAEYLRDMVLDRRAIYIKTRKQLQDLGEAAPEFSGDRGYPNTNYDIVGRMEVWRARDYALMMLRQVVGLNRTIAAIETHVEQVLARIQREQEGRQQVQQQMIQIQREAREAKEAREARQQEGQQAQQSSGQENASREKGEEERRKRPWEL